ncbi:MAG: alkyl hydroperoxide reductase [Planctomycetes bacterium]|nr:alkyl hydroperoxide reductase [Planctomycetota bacterium]
MRNAVWHRPVLVMAGVYNLVWGALVAVAPRATLEWLGLDATSAVTRNIWACVGMIVGVYGVGYLIAARDPLRHWPIVLVGLLGKILGPLGFVFAAVRGELPWTMGWTLITNDLAWWLPFGFLLLAVRRARH